MGRIRRSRTHKGIKDYSKKYRTRKYTKDLDQIHEDLKKSQEKTNNEKLNQEQEQQQLPHDIDPDLPGLGQHYCIACAIKLLKEVPYTQAEAEAAVGFTTEHARVRLMDEVV
ncbi:6171_t:CDS:2 [Ambispora leptoticha]|uniref:6171_t:CDS:1 n=1 Tax=Ambispora leptoticha TaxID=144679 RepID=A0A9N8YS23_9GLOM|nr:6171_t:CDS:2 [Ambispora leptoticha]